MHRRAFRVSRIMRMNRHIRDRPPGWQYAYVIGTIAGLYIKYKQLKLRWISQAIAVGDFRGKRTIMP
jgi:hypothetical protein